jgi:hypothetical protein
MKCKTSPPSLQTAKTALKGGGAVTTRAKRGAQASYRGRYGRPLTRCDRTLGGHSRPCGGASGVDGRRGDFCLFATIKIVFADGGYTGTPIDWAEAAANDLGPMSRPRQSAGEILRWCKERVRRSRRSTPSLPIRTNIAPMAKSGNVSAIAPRPMQVPIRTPARSSVTAHAHEALLYLSYSHATEFFR